MPTALLRARRGSPDPAALWSPLPSMWRQAAPARTESMTRAERTWRQATVKRPGPRTCGNRRRGQETRAKRMTRAEPVAGARRRGAGRHAHGAWACVLLELSLTLCAHSLHGELTLLTLRRSPGNSQKLHFTNSFCPDIRPLVIESGRQTQRMDEVWVT